MPTCIDDAIPPALAAHLSARLARMLLANGADASYTLDRVASAGRALHADLHIELGDGAVLVTASGRTEFATRVGRALPAMGVDMAKLSAIDALIDELCQRPGSARALDARLDAIETVVGGHPAPWVVLGVAVTAASLARLFGATWPIVGVAFIAGLVSTVLRRRLAASRINAIAAAFIVAFASGVVAAAASRLLPNESPVLCLTAAGMILVPGVPLINGIRDLVEGHAGIAVSRLALGAATVLAIGFALFLAAGAAGVALPVGEGPGRIGIAEDAAFSAAAVLGYSMLFDVPMRALPYSIACGVVSHASRTALATLGVDIATGSLLGALFAGLVARVAGRSQRMPAVTFAFPGTVAMIPGSYGFRAGIGGLHVMSLGPTAGPALVATTLSLAITTAVVTTAIGIGLSLAFAMPTFPLSNHSRKET